MSLHPIVTAVLLGAVCLGACSDSPVEPMRPPLEHVPPDLAAITLEAHGQTTAPYTLLELRATDGFSGFVAVDASGLPVWYFRTVGNPFGATRRTNGNFILLDSGWGLLEVDREGEVLRALAQEERPGRRIHHDVTTTPWNTVLFIAGDTRPWPDTLVSGEAVWEWSPETDEVVKRWSSFNDLDPEADRGERSRSTDWLHANSVSVGPDDNVLVSLHYLNQVISIEPDFGGIEWRLGGVGATIEVADPFSGQHTAAQLSTGNVILFDNGFDRVDERYSRAVEYRLGDTTADVVWQWRPERDNWARVISSARRLPNGNRLVAFGTRADTSLGTTGPIEVYEVDIDGAVLWHLSVGGEVSSLYRASPLFGF